MESFRGRGTQPRRPVPDAPLTESDIAAAMEAQAPAAPMRAALRADPREEDPRAAAERRAAEIRQHLGGLDEGTDDFYIPPGAIPDGWSYEWKRRTIYNQEDPAYQVHLARTGWEAVPATRHPEMMPANGKYQTIERKGMVLMMRPKSITDEFRRIDQKAARDQIRHKEAQLNAAPDGQFTRDHAQVRPKIGKSYEAIPIPND